MSTLHRSRSRRYNRPKSEARPGLPSVLNLCSLPLDVIVHINTFVDPSDIYSLRLCCKTLHNASYERIIWMNALRRVCRINAVFLQTFHPIEDMSLSELEHAATSPTRYAAYLRGSLPGTTGAAVQPFVTRVLIPRFPRQPGSPAVTTEFRHLNLIPGGRFMLTCQENGLLCLWDLGLGTSIVNPCPLASIQAQASDIDMMTQPSRDGNSIRVVSISALPHDTFAVDVYEINPTSPVPVFSKIATLVSSGQLSLVEEYCLSPDHFACLVESRVVVWNFHEDTWSSWNVRDRYVQVLLQDETLILWDTERISIWTLPPLVSRVETIGPLGIREPAMVLVSPFSASIYPYQLEWWTDRPSPVFDFIGENVENQSHVARFALQKIITPANADFPRCLPVLLSVTPLQNERGFLGEAFNIKHARIGSKDVVITWREGTQLDVKGSISTIPAHRGDAVQSTSFTLWEASASSMGGGGATFGHCPSSGRLCVITGAQEIRIMDFVLPQL